MSLHGFAENVINRRPGQLLSYAFGFASILLYLQIAYFTERTDTVTLLICYVILFILYLMLTKSILSFKFLMGFGIAFRLVFLFSMPNLSDDFYRFFWDGILINNQINPFLYLPREIIDNPAIQINALSTDLFNSLNSPDYYTVYPPVCQFIFWIASSLGNITSAVLIMKISMFFAEIGSIYLFIRLLKIHQLKREYVYFYMFNPLIIIELIGNIHFEAFLILFVLWAVYLLQKNKWILASFAMALAISSKLTPILMFPFFLKRLKLKKSLIFYGLVLILVAISFLPFSGASLINGMGSSLGLYFQKFEFNASIFYVVREIGFWVNGWDIIQVASKWLALSTVTIICILSLFENTEKENIPGILIWSLFIYFAFASIIHPWYATPILVFSWFSRYRFPIVWSFTIFFSYAGYSVDGFQEQLWVLLFQYVLVYGVMLYELITFKDLIRLQNPWKEITG